MFSPILESLERLLFEAVRARSLCATEVALRTSPFPNEASKECVELTRRIYKVMV